jgi:hypothetical protein
MIKPMLSPAYWLTFSRETREKLIRLFTISRSGGSIVENVNGIGKVVSDGHTDKDLMAINIEVLQKMLATQSTDFYALLQQVIDEIDKFLEIKESGAVDSDWNFTQTAKEFDEPETYKVSDTLDPGDRVRVKNGMVYLVAKPAGRPKKNVNLQKETK